MTAPDPRLGEIVPRDLIAFAKECADPDWSLSIPPVAKGVITQLLAELRKRDDVIAKLSDWAGRSKSAYYDEAQDDVVQIIRPVLRAAVAAATAGGQ